MWRCAGELANARCLAPFWHGNDQRPAPTAPGPSSDRRRPEAQNILIIPRGCRGGKRGAVLSRPSSRCVRRGRRLPRPNRVLSLIPRLSPSLDQNAQLRRRQAYAGEARGEVQRGCLPGERHWTARAQRCVFQRRPDLYQPLTLPSRRELRSPRPLFRGISVLGEPTTRSGGCRPLVSASMGFAS